MQGTPVSPRFVFEEAHMPRFHLGQKVLITGPIASKDRGREATVIGVVQTNTHRLELQLADKYIVRFEQGDEAQCFEIQLVSVEERKKGA